MWKNVVEPDRPQIKTWRMRIACWIPKATNTHLQYVTLIAFPLQQQLHERASVLRYTSFACLVTSEDSAWTKAPEALRPADISLLAVLQSGWQSWFCVLSRTYCTSPRLQTTTGDNWQGRKSTLLERYLSRRYFVHHISDRTRTSVVRSRWLAAWVTTWQIIDGRRIGCACSGT